MQFDFDRIALLAGIESDEGSGVLAETAEHLTESRVAGEKEKLDEATFRRFIRSEIKSMLADMSKVPSEGDDWIYGSGPRPTMSKGGRVHLGMLGIGFKQI